MTLRTVGHGAQAADELVDLLASAGVTSVVDVRRFPGSRRHPHFGRDEMARWLAEAGIAYRWEPELGGRRAPVEGSPHLALRNSGFRAYADHMETPEFGTALAEVVAGAEAAPTAVLCAEGLWWNCHRRLLADAVVLRHEVEVEHILPDGRRSAHTPTEGVRRDGDRLVYDVGVTPPLGGMPA